MISLTISSGIQKRGAYVTISRGQSGARGGGGIDMYIL